MRTDVYSFRPLLLLIPALLLLASCGVVQQTTGSSDRIPAPILSEEDVTYFEVGDIIQEGLASWYGPKFQRKLTANGEIYEMDDLTAAHRTLPFNTRIRVTNQSNGKSVDVRVNDRGPYVGDRIIDLSRGAARAIDMIDDGVGHVKLQLLQTGDRQVNSANASSQENFTVQLASFDSHNQALLEAEQIAGAEVVPVRIARETIYRVYYGSYPHPDEAEQQLRQLRKQGYNGFVKQREN
ncbi:MAG: septal ring lytic transglycosylase RlpA family protein [Balneolaceae bacterium]